MFCDIRNLTVSSITELYLIITVIITLTCGRLSAALSNAGVQVGEESDDVNVTVNDIT